MEALGWLFVSCFWCKPVVYDYRPQPNHQAEAVEDSLRYGGQYIKDQKQGFGIFCVSACPRLRKSDEIPMDRT